jgi:putative Mn2+ efflux pump MntP
MWIFEAFMLAVGLSMDAFAVSVCKGLSMKKATLKHGMICGGWFGSFQALMPLMGYLLGSLFAVYIRRFDHWIAFGLLAFIGINMLREAFSKEEECCCSEADLSVKTMFVMAIATSIDALAAGISLAMSNDSALHVYITIGMIGVITFLMSTAGVKIGNIFGSRFEKKAQAAGGIILVLLGLKILLEHLLTDLGVIG